MRPILTLLLLTAAAYAQPGSDLTKPGLSTMEWRARYYFDSARETLRFADLASPSPDRAIAVGTVMNEKKREPSRHVSLVTSDGGAHWTENAISEPPQSVYFVNESLGWMVTQKNLWQSNESGHSWQRIYKHDGMVRRVWFLDAKHGFAIGASLDILESLDGGRHWKKLNINYGDDRPTNVTYSQIAFVDARNGVIFGNVTRQNKDRISQTTRVMLRTNDGGATWHFGASQFRGNVTDLRTVGGELLAIVATSKPSATVDYDVYRIDLTNLEASLLLDIPDRIVTSAVVFGSRGYVATAKIPDSFSPGLRQLVRDFPPFGNIGFAARISNLPGELHVLQSTGLKDWSETRLDYRAEGRSAMLAGTDPAHLYLATDEGMILRLE